MTQAREHVSLLHFSALAAHGVSKSFGERRALDDVTFEVAPGEVVALVGENGAGKSTLLKVLAGFVSSDAGVVTEEGFAFRPDAGVRHPKILALVHQQFLLMDALTVAENVVLGDKRGVLFDPRAAERAVGETARRFGLAVDPRAKVGDLGVAERQRVELLKALAPDPRFVLLDEPTALLPPTEVASLLALLRRLAADGRGVVLVTHRLREAMAVASRIVVMRQGRVVAERRVAETNESEIARLMVGEDVVAAAPTSRRNAGGAPLLDVAELVCDGVRGVSFVVRAGEIVGVAGVSGNGQSELVEALAGVRPASARRLALSGADLRALDVAGRRRAGLGVVPEDRDRDGLAPDLSLAENLALAGCAGDVASILAEHDVRPPDADAPAASLSGGNRQKLLLAREFVRGVSFLVAAEPARGLDFRATESAHRRLRAVAETGGGVLLVSTDLAELLAVCDRVLVMFAGRVVGEVDPATTTDEELGRMLSGSSS